MAQPFFNTNYRVASTAPAAAIIAQTDTGKMFANLGKTIGNTLEKYRDNKEKKERQEMSENMFLRQYESNPDNPLFKNLGIENSEEAKEVAKAVSKDPSLVNDAIRLGQIATQAQDRELRNFLLRDQQNRMMQKEQSDRNVAKFNFDRPEMPITEDTPGEKMPELDPDPFAPPPSTFLEDSRAVTMLPERFQGQGRQVQDAVESGQLSPLEGNRIIESIYSQAMAEQKAGPTRSEILAREKYEDEKAATASEKEILDTESTNNLTDFYNETSDLLDKINEETVDVTGPIEGTSVYRFFSKLGDTDDEQVRRRLEMFTRKLTLDAAQNLKGALSDKDIRFLVEQAPDMDDNPSVWKKYMGDLKIRLERNAKQKGIDFENTNSPQQSTNTIDPADLENAIQAKRKLLEQRKMMQQTLDNPNVPNYGPQ